MTTKPHVARLLLALSAALIAAPLAAQDRMVVSGEHQDQERVSFTDLDLRQGSAQLALRIRVRGASERVCKGPGDNLDGFLSASICTQATYHDARPQITAAIARAKSGQQMAFSLIVSRPARAR